MLRNKYVIIGCLLLCTICLYFTKIHITDGLDTRTLFWMIGGFLTSLVPFAALLNYIFSQYQSSPSPNTSWAIMNRTNNDTTLEIIIVCTLFGMLWTWILSWNPSPTEMYTMILRIIGILTLASGLMAFIMYAIMGERDAD